MAVSSWAVTFTWMTFSPAASATWRPSSVPASAIIMPFASRYSIVALGLSVVGVTVTFSTAFGTHAA